MSLVRNFLIDFEGMVLDQIISILSCCLSFTFQSTYRGFNFEINDRLAIVFVVHCGMYCVHGLSGVKGNTMGPLFMFYCNINEYLCI